MPYHVTKKENVRLILEKGLVPSYGENSRLCGDGREKAVWFCGERDAPYWMILTGSDAMIRISDDVFSYFTDEQILEERYSNYLEYGVRHKIPAKFLSISENPSQETLDKANALLASDHMLKISMFVNSILCLSENCDMFTARIYDEDCTNLIRILKRIDFEKAGTHTLIKNLAWQIYDFGESTFIDHMPYLDKNAPRRYKLLNRIDGWMKNAGQAFYEFITENIPHEILKLESEEIKRMVLVDQEKEA